MRVWDAMCVSVMQRPPPGVVQLAFISYELDDMACSSSEVKQREYRPMIFYDWKKGLSANQCHESMCSAFGSSAPSMATITYWYREFVRGRRSFEDEDRPGRPVEIVTDEVVQRVEKLVRYNRSITTREIAESVGIGSAAVQTILHDRLALRKLSSRWVPHLLSEVEKQQRVDWCRFMLEKFEEGRSKRVGEILTGDETWVYKYDPETKHQSSVWVFENEDAPMKVIRSRSVDKRMVAVFFRRQGLVKAVPLVEQATVTAHWYTTVCLPQVFAELQNTRPKTGLRGILLHQDNASAHTAAVTMDFLHQSDVQLLPHPPYSPDLAPCDFFLFPKVKLLLKGKHYESKDAALAAFNGVLNDIGNTEWVACFESWFQRMSHCIQSSGNYFEKM
jgi:histone-lysine N-methyltransferase SETMAR